MNKFKSMLPKNILDKYNVGCKISGKHVHLYQKIVDGHPINSYILGEKKNVDGYRITNRFMRSDRFYNEILKILNKNDLFRCEQNLDYLYYQNTNKISYLEYEYNYVDFDIKFELDEEGYLIPLVATVVHKGWHENGDDKNNTGKVRECKKKFFGYKIVMKKNKPVLVKSPLVDNIKVLFNEYPYFSEKCYEVVVSEVPTYSKRK